ncbi:hypothetical protein TSUD_225160 [Trifolium subterraneum]|uniref:WRKY domain-containing protein n=1 Tax=Trifolium subterraneum TaxID=3900 RepID=A0A2Z6M0T7_TRISU|nr:hypothetical protein TSUD_225160 [Trifolium subterraneum]
MTVEFIMEYINNKFQENAVEEAASGLQNIDKLIKLLSSNTKSNSMEFIEKIDQMDYKTVVDVAVSKFKNVISLLSQNRTRTGHARFRRAHLPSSTTFSETRVYHATPLQHIPPMVPKSGGLIQNKNIIDFSANSFMSSSCLFCFVELLSKGYYKCSSVKGCPAQKHVERALDDSSMLVVTYEGEHNHSLSMTEANNLILESS